MNRAERIEADKRKHEHDLMDRRLGEQRIIDELSDKLEPIKTRITSLEHSRTRFKGVITGVSLAWGALVAYLTHGGKVR